VLLKQNGLVECGFALIVFKVYVGAVFEEALDDGNVAFLDKGNNEWC
jgi:hypothetical protein